MPETRAQGQNLAFSRPVWQRGAAVMVVKQLAGRADLSTTQRYANMVGSDLGAALALFGAGEFDAKARE